MSLFLIYTEVGKPVPFTPPSAPLVSVPLRVRNQGRRGPPKDGFAITDGLASDHFLQRNDSVAGRRGQAMRSALVTFIANRIERGARPVLRFAIVHDELAEVTLALDSSRIPLPGWFPDPPPRLVPGIGRIHVVGNRGLGRADIREVGLWGRSVRRANRRRNGPAWQQASGDSSADGRIDTPKFKEIFSSAGMDLDDAANKVAIPGHKGPHPKEYHEAILKRLSNATKRKKALASRQKALKAELAAEALIPLPGCIASDASGWGRAGDGQWSRPAHRGVALDGLID